MKKKFIGYYSPNTEEIEKSWEKGIFAFDANTLLNLYRYTENTRNDFIRALGKIKEKLFLPYQAAYEYHENRLGVIEGIEKSYNEINSILIENFDRNLQKQLNHYKKHPSILIDKIIKIHDDFLLNVSKELNEQKSKHPDFKSEDDVLNDITELFDNCVGEEFSKDELTKIYTEGKERYANEIPPGYKDAKTKQKKGLRNIYGDLIIWKELLNYTKNKKLPLIFITDDRKEDWWTIEKGETIRPREELIKEFFDFTGIRILIYNADNFLYFAKERGLLPEIKEETIEEVKNIRVSDEKYYTKISDILSTQSFASKSMSDMLSTQSHKPISISDLLSSQTLASKSISDMLSAQSYKPISVSDILNSQVLATKNISDMLSAQTYKPIGVSDLLSSQTLASKSISDMLSAQTQSSKNISDLVNYSSKTFEGSKKKIKKAKNKKGDDK